MNQATTILTCSDVDPSTVVEQQPYRFRIAEQHSRMQRVASMALIELVEIQPALDKSPKHVFPERLVFDLYQKAASPSMLNIGNVPRVDTGSEQILPAKKAVERNAPPPLVRAKYQTLRILPPDQSRRDHNVRPQQRRY
jgi:hypothetical protein